MYFRPSISLFQASSPLIDINVTLNDSPEDFEMEPDRCFRVTIQILHADSER